MILASRVTAVVGGGSRRFLDYSPRLSLSLAYTWDRDHGLTGLWVRVRLCRTHPNHHDYSPASQIPLDLHCEPKDKTQGKSRQNSQRVKSIHVSAFSPLVPPGSIK
jgi:hypothetical protein